MKGACKVQNEGVREGGAAGDGAHGGVHTVSAAGVRRLLAHMLRRRCNASFSITPRARATTPPASAGCHCFETSLDEKITPCITRRTHCVAPSTPPSCSIFHMLGASLSLSLSRLSLSIVMLSFIFVFFSSLLKATRCLRLARFSVLSLNHWPFLSCFFFFFSRGSCSPRRLDFLKWRSKKRKMFLF